ALDRIWLACPLSRSTTSVGSNPKRSCNHRCIVSNIDRNFCWISAPSRPMTITWWMMNQTNPESTAMAKITASNAEKRSEEHTSELQSRENLVCRLLLEKKNNQILTL